MLGGVLMLACLLAYCLVLLLLVPPRLLAVPLAHEGAHLLAALGLPPVRHAARPTCLLGFASPPPPLVAALGRFASAAAPSDQILLPAHSVTI